MFALAYSSSSSSTCVCHPHVMCVCVCVCVCEDSVVPGTSVVVFDMWLRLVAIVVWLIVLVLVVEVWELWLIPHATCQTAALSCDQLHSLDSSRGGKT